MKPFIISYFENNVIKKILVTSNSVNNAEKHFKKIIKQSQILKIILWTDNILIPEYRLGEHKIIKNIC